jgi:hypothetical protein
MVDSLGIVENVFSSALYDALKLLLIFFVSEKSVNLISFAAYAFKKNLLTMI